MTRRRSLRPGTLQADLLEWFRSSQRDLPWRRTKDPYAIWISEVMLQQTQVATVIPYWERFLDRFPTVTDLAEAPLDDVLARWSGLGYYARARNLHRAAQVVAAEHGGRFPRSVEALRKLPGFGPYTAAAVGSIAFGLDAALVDGNVARVLCRLGGWRVDADEARARAWEEAPPLLPLGEAGDWNQALMELGATICTPMRPTCDRCPVARHCQASGSEEPAMYPLPKPRKARKVLRYAALAVRDGERVLLRRRADKGLFGGLWELPSEEISGTAEEALSVITRELALSASPRHAGRVEQTLTHREVGVDVFVLDAPLKEVPADGRLASGEELGSIGLSSLARKVLAVAGFVTTETRQRPRKHDRQAALF